MALSLVKIEVNGTRRVRLCFDRQLAAGAFTSTTYYAISSVDSRGVVPAILKALAVGASTGAVELVLDQDIVEGARYSADITAVPAQDATTFTGSQHFGTGEFMGASPDGSIVREDADAWLFGIDALWEDDFVESPQGDLAEIAGLPNVMAAGWRRVRAMPLPWNSEYGGRLEEYVGAPITSQLAARGRITQQMLRDDRVEAVSVRISVDDTKATPEIVFVITPQLRGGRSAPSFSTANAF